MLNYKIKKAFICALSTCAMMTPVTLYAQQAPLTPGIENIHDNPALGPYSFVGGISADGSVVIAGNGADSFYWTEAGGMQNIIPAGFFAGGITEAKSVSADGSTIMGYGYDADGYFRSYRWTEAGGIELLDTANVWTNGSTTAGSSSDGTYISGHGYDVNGFSHAFRWSEAGGMQAIDNLNLFQNGSQSAAISADGSIIAGLGYTASYQNHAFRWTEAGGIEDIHDSSFGWDYSTATVMSSDGSVIAGYGSDATYNSLAFRWTEAGGMENIHDSSFGWVSSSATAISADGSTIVGGAHDASSMTHAFRWTEAGGMENIEDMTAGWTASVATTVSGDGSVIGGLIIGTSTGYSPFRWTSATGMQDIYELLVSAGIDMTGWSTLATNPVFVSEDGTKIVGTGVYNGNGNGWIFTLGEDGGGGLITPEELQQALAGATVPQQQAQAAMSSSFDQSLMVARNALSGYLRNTNYGSNTSAASSNLEDISPAAGGTMRRKALYAVGALGIGQNDNFSNKAVNGSTGALFGISDEAAIGVGIIGSYNREETRLGGKSRSRAGGVQLMASHESADDGLRLYGTATVAKLDVSNERRYMNGGGVDSSTGKTDGIGYGAAAKVGYEFALPGKKSMTLMPYTELDVSHVSLDGYTETGGGFPAVVGDQNSTFVASRIGAEVSAPVSAKALVRGRAAWGHRYSNGGAAVSTVAGITQSIPTDAGERDWAELGVGINWRLNEDTTLTGDISGRVGRTSEPAANMIVGVVWNWN